MKLSLLEWIERSVLAVWEKIADFLAKDREARKLRPSMPPTPSSSFPFRRTAPTLRFSES